MTTFARLRTLLLLVLLGGFVGTAAELALLEHWEDGWQWVPFVLLALGTGVGVAFLVRPAGPARRLMRWTMALFVVAGVVGIQRHYHGNREFELEMRPSLEGMELVTRTLGGATPALAPGTMAFMGLIGLLLTLPATGPGYSMKEE